MASYFLDREIPAATVNHLGGISEEPEPLWASPDWIEEWAALEWADEEVRFVAFIMQSLLHMSSHDDFQQLH